MKIKTVALTNFRNYPRQNVVLGPGLNFIIGANGEGKTNFLEAIYTLSLVKSYKSPDLDLIRLGTETSRVTGTLESKNRDINLMVALSAEGKSASFNLTPVSRLSDYIGILNVVLFTPDDMNLIKGGPSERRYFLDLVLGQTDKGYLQALSDYKHVLKQRNELLKQLQDRKTVENDVLDILSDQLASCGEIVMAKRNAFVEKIGQDAGMMYSFLTTKEEKMTMVFQPSVSLGSLRQELRHRLSSDLFSGTTNTGPHRDDLEWFLAGQSARNYASQGEQRMIVLSVSMALCDYIGEIKGDRPIFLLDDVFSELDSVRQNRLIHYLIDSGNQALITATSLVEIDPLFIQQAKIFQVFQGSIREDHHHGQ